MPGDMEIKLARWESSGLRMAVGPHTLEVGRIALHDLVARLRADGSQVRLQGLHAAGAELGQVGFEGPLGPAAAAGSRLPPAGAAWTLEPLGTADGTLRAEIVDAHLVFDAQVTVPIGRGGIDFNRATVEHVGPDSRMGVSRMGIYVDAPNGRSYVYQFPSAPAAGVSYERRGPLPGPWATDRGSLQLQPFVEALLRHGPGKAGSGLTGQARLLLGRTALAGEVQLGDGKVASSHAQGQLWGRAAGHNRVRLGAAAVGRGIDLAVPALAIRAAELSHQGTRIAADEIQGELALRVFAESGQLRFSLRSAGLKIAGLRLDA